MKRLILLGCCLLLVVSAIIVLTIEKPNLFDEADFEEERDFESLEFRLGLIASEAVEGNHPSLTELFKQCGEPDSYVEGGDGELLVAYFYDRFGKDDWVAYVTVEKGLVKEVGFNGASVNDHSDFKPWSFEEGDIPGFK